MAFRFRRTISIIPGLRLNVAKKGVSVSAGVPGATLNVGKQGVTRTVGIPGTGLSDRSRLTGARSLSAGELVIVILLIIGAFVGLAVWAMLG